jgi:O-antigen biosynthesis protein
MAKRAAGKAGSIAPVVELLADQYRADVAEALDCEAACGFSFSPPPALRHRAWTSFRFFTMPGREEIKGSPFEIVYPEETARERIEGLIKRADELFSFAYHLRRDLKAALPRDRHTLGDYAAWAAQSLPLALPRAVMRYGALPPGMPLVSIVCPVFRPEIGAFLAAVDSVRWQSWRKSGGSTAAGGSRAKPKAADAGAKAVAAHLARRGLEAEVRSRGGLTCYRTG